MADENRKPYGRHDPDMDLPPGKTCGDCAHFPRCNLMFGHIAADESCDWAPSRFRQRRATPARPVVLAATYRPAHGGYPSSTYGVMGGGSDAGGNALRLAGAAGPSKGGDTA